ncbi:MAG: MFS transporter [Candidatus Dormibacteraceae bacterium]
MLTVGIAAAAASGLLFAYLAARIGRRATLALTGGLMVLSGIDLAFATAPWLLVVAGVTGMLGTSSVDQGPFSAVEQAVLTESVDASHRNLAFARYSLTGGLAAAAGGLIAALATNLQRTQEFFVLYAALGLVTAILPLLMSATVETQTARAPVFGSVRPLLGLYGLMALDSFGGGLIVQSVVAYWLHVRFGAGLEVLGPSFGAMAVIQALSYEAAGHLANRFGLVNTMVFTHLPSNLLILFVPFAPNLAWALGLLLLRFAVSSMDVPARQAYIVSIVPPAERAGAVAVGAAVRGAAQAVGPILAGVAIQTAMFGLPFFIGGGLKVVYDLALYAGFRNRLADHEAKR